MEVGELARSIRIKLGTAGVLPEMPPEIPPDQINSQTTAQILLKILDDSPQNQEDPGRKTRIKHTITNVMGNMTVSGKNKKATRDALTHALDILVEANAMCKEPVVNNPRDEFCYRVTNLNRLNLIAEGEKEKEK